MVNNLNLSGTLLHDLNYTTHYGNNSYFEFYANQQLLSGFGMGPNLRDLHIADSVEGSASQCSSL